MNNKDNIVPKNIFQRSFSWDILAVILFILCLGLSIWKLPYGMATPDEGFYLSIPYRLLQGDKLLLHEWHVTQLAALLQLPLLKVWLGVAGSTEGIVLVFRGIYLLCHSIAAIYIYMRLRELSAPAALCAGLMFLIYAPFNISALSYNSMGIDLVCVALLTVALSRGKVWEMILSGLCFAAAVLCNPYYFLLYLVYTIAVLVCKIRQKETICQLLPRFWLCFTAAAAVVALIAAFEIFVGTDFSRLGATVPAVISGDTAEHPTRSLFGILYGMFASFGKNGLFIPTLAVSVCMMLAVLLDKKREKHTAFYLCIAAVLSIAYGLWFRIYAHAVMNFYMFPVCILGFFAWLLSDGRRNALFFFVYLPGVLCWFCAAMASNLGFINIASVSTINMLASTVFICDAVAAHFGGKGLKKASALLMIVAILVPFSTLLECKAFCYYPMRPVTECTQRVEKGPMHGLLAEQGEFERYDAAQKAADAVRDLDGNAVMYLTDIPTQYLEDEKLCGSYSAWFPGVSVNYNVPRLHQYWELFPERIPEYILVGMEDPAANDFLRQSFAEGYTETDLGNSFWLLERK